MKLNKRQKNKRAQGESMAYANMVQVGNLGSGEQITVKTLVPIGSKPQLKLTVLNEKTKELETITK